MRQGPGFCPAADPAANIFAGIHIGRLTLFEAVRCCRPCGCVAQAPPRRKIWTAPQPPRPH